MGLLDRFKEKIDARKERQKQIYERSRPERLASLQREIDFQKKLKEERDLKTKIRGLRREAMQEKLRPARETIAGVKKLAKGSSNIGKRIRESAAAANKRQEAIFGNSNPREAIFGDEKKKTVKPKVTKRVIYEYK